MLYKGVTQPWLRERSSGREDAIRTAAGKIRFIMVKRMRIRKPADAFFAALLLFVFPFCGTLVENGFV